MTTQLDLLALKVQRLLSDFLNDIRLADDGAYLVPYESTMVVVRPMEISEESTAVMVFGLVARDVPVSPAFYEWVARTTDNFTFGHIGIDVDDIARTAVVVFSHTLLGDCLDAEELRTVVCAVATTADDLDDEVQDRFGGQRWVDEDAA